MNLNMRTNSVIIIAFIASILISVSIWIGQTDLNEQTRYKLKLMAKAVKQHLKLTGTQPDSMTDIRISQFAKELNSPYDSWGSRISFTPVSNGKYIIKSFGSDKQENTLKSSIDLITTNINQSVTRFPCYSYSGSLQCLGQGFLLISC